MEMEADTVVMSFLALFIGVFAFQSMFTSMGTGILARIGGLFRIDVKPEDVVAISLLPSFFAIFALLSLYAPGGILIRICGLFGVWTRPCAPFSWVAALVTITKGGDKCLLSLLSSTYAEND